MSEESPPPNIQNVGMQIGDNAAVGGDVTGRDMITAGGHVIQAGVGATVIVEVQAPITEPQDDSPTLGEPPFKGLQYFDENDADLFFGRELLVAKLVGQLRGHRFLAIVVGASGSGKSSVVRAGIVPALRRGEPLADGTLPPIGSAHWPIHILTPTSHPLESLAASLTRDSESVSANATLQDDLKRDARSLHLYARRLLSKAGGERLLLIVDQFEELFTLCRDDAERQAFLNNLMTAVSPETDGPTTIVITLRADFYAYCAQYPALREAVSNHQEFIGPMTAYELRRAIEEPAKRGGWELEAGLVDMLLKDVGDEPGGLPLLSHALLEVWKRRRGRKLTLSGYADSGGVRGAIAKTADSVYTGFSESDKAIARRLFISLTELGEGTQDTRRRAALADLMPNPADAPAVRAVLDKLVSARLVTTDDKTAEVAHEALIREWPALRQWLAENREGLRLHRQLADDARRWAELDRETGSLLRGVRLVQAAELLEEQGDHVSALEREFIEASHKQAERDEAERETARLQTIRAETAQKLAVSEKSASRRLRWLTLGLVTVFTFAFAYVCMAMSGFASLLASDKVDSDLRIALLTTVNNINTEQFQSLVSEGQPNQEGFSDDPRYWMHIHELDGVSSLIPGAHAATYVSGKQPNEIVFIGDAWVIHAKERAAGFKQAVVLPDDGSMNSIDFFPQDISIGVGVIADSYGSWQSGRVPLRDGQNNIIGILGVDIDAGDLDRARVSAVVNLVTPFATAYVSMLIMTVLILWAIPAVGNFLRRLKQQRS